LTTAIYVVAPLSGGHLNPAVTFSFAMARATVAQFVSFQHKVIPYACAQLLAAMLAAAMDLFSFYKAIGRFEQKHQIVRGQEQDSDVSAAAFGDYWRHELRPYYVYTG
jgi:glycerol uptake facilitator protein